MNILTLADGFGDCAIDQPGYGFFPKWPSIIQLMTRGCQIQNLAKYGAGNEYLSYCLQENFQENNVVLIQWAMSTRLDLILAHEEPHLSEWKNQIQQDPVYKNNLVKLNNVDMWISSGSKLESVQQYHHRYISRKQHQMRSQLFIEYARLLLQSHNIPFAFFLTWDSEYLDQYINHHDHWCWHRPWHGMHSWRYHSDFCELDLGFTQPIPLIQYDFIKKFVMPTVDLPWRNQQELNALESMLYKKHKEQPASCQ